MRQRREVQQLAGILRMAAEAEAGRLRQELCALEDERAGLVDASPSITSSAAGAALEEVGIAGRLRALSVREARIRAEAEKASRAFARARALGRVVSRMR